MRITNGAWQAINLAIMRICSLMVALIVLGYQPELVILSLSIPLPSHASAISSVLALTCFRWLTLLLVVTRTLGWRPIYRRTYLDPPFLRRWDMLLSFPWFEFHGCRNTPAARQAEGSRQDGSVGSSPGQRRSGGSNSVMLILHGMLIVIQLVNTKHLMVDIT